MYMQANHKPKKLIVFGRTGVGKTSLLNKIAGQELFKPGHTLTSQTSKVESQVVTWPQQPSCEVELVDVPGFGDNRESMAPELVLQEIAEFLFTLQDGLHIALFCISAKTRVDAHDLLEFDTIGLLLGSPVFEHVFVAVTQINTLVAQSKQAAYFNFRDQLPGILAKQGHPSFTRDKIVFADFDNFKNEFLNPISRILPAISAYKPILAEGLDINDPETFKKITHSKEFQEYQKKMETRLEEERKRSEMMQETFKKQIDVLERTMEKSQKDAQESERRALEIQNQLKEHQRRSEQEKTKSDELMRRNQQEIQQSREALTKIQYDHQLQMQQMRSQLEQNNKLIESERLKKDNECKLQMEIFTANQKLKQQEFQTQLLKAENEKKTLMIEEAKNASQRTTTTLNLEQQKNSELEILKQLSSALSMLNQKYSTCQDQINRITLRTNAVQKKQTQWRNFNPKQQTVNLARPPTGKQVFARIVKRK